MNSFVQPKVPTNQSLKQQYLLNPRILIIHDFCMPMRLQVLCVLGGPLVFCLLLESMQGQHRELSRIEACQLQDHGNA